MMLTMTPANSTLAQETTAFLTIDNVSKVYPTLRGPYPVLEGVNLTVKEGEFICIIGHSGCGKSTLLNMISGFNQPTEGTVKLREKSITGPGPDRMMVFQNYCLLPWKTAQENVFLAVNAVYPDKSKAEKEQLVAHYLEMVGLTEAAQKKPGQISGGMKQRVAIARALAIAPEVLILDEPFGALDAITKEELQEELLKIWREKKLTVLMITHDIDEALFLADRLVMMTNGPSAKIGEILPIPFSRPRNRTQINDDPRYYELRNYALDFLFHRYAHDEEDEVKEDLPNGGLLIKKIFAGLTSLAAIALVGIGLAQTFSFKGGNGGSTPTELSSPVKP
jgi:nitrate/nitrite transport system ATP-binding protein